MPFESELITECKREYVARNRNSDNRNYRSKCIPHRIVPYSRNNAENQTDKRSEEHRLESYSHAHRQTLRYELAYGRVLADIIADAKIAAEHIAHILKELHDDRLIKAVLNVQCGSLVVIEFFIIERRTGHKLQQNKKNKRNCQQRE